MQKGFIGMVLHHQQRRSSILCCKMDSSKSSSGAAEPKGRTQNANLRIQCGAGLNTEGVMGWADWRRYNPAPTFHLFCSTRLQISFRGAPQIWLLGSLVTLTSLHYPSILKCKMKLLQSQKRSTLPKSPNDLDTEYFKAWGIDFVLYI